MIRLSLPMPPGKNRTGRAGMTRSGRLSRPGLGLKEQYFEDVKLATIAAGCYQVGMPGRLELTINYYWPSERGMLDIDAGRNWLQDCLAKNIGFNDRAIRAAHEYIDIDKGVQPHCTVELREIAKGGQS